MWYQTLIKQQIDSCKQAWLQQFRQQHAEQFINAGFPVRKQEDWKYTDLGKLEYEKFAVTNKAIQNANLINKHIISDQYYLIVFNNGRFNSELSNINIDNKNIVVSPLTQALQQHSKLVQQYLGNIATANKNSMLNFNNAALQDGLFIYLPDNSRLDKPLQALFINDQPQSVQCYRNLIITEDNTELTLIEHYTGNNASDYLTNAATEIHAGANSHIQHYRNQLEGDNAQHIGGLYWRQQSNSQCYSYNFALGSLLDRYDIHSIMDAQHTFCDMQGIYLANNKQHLDTHTRVDHLQPHGTSNEHYKGIIGDNAQAVFNGKVIVHKDAQKTEAAQSNNNILLTKMAEIDTKPELEIYADDVKCSHGATIGALDDNALFYLRSRGLSKQNAQLLLTSAFTDEVIDKITQVEIKNYIYQQVHLKLATMLQQK